MKHIQYDLSLTSYALLGLFVIAHELFGLHNALALAGALLAVWAGLALLLTMPGQWRRHQQQANRPLHMGGEDSKTLR